MPTGQRHLTGHLSTDLGPPERGVHSPPLLPPLSSFLSRVCVAEEFQVIGPTDPIVAVLGKDIMLPCRVSPAMNVRNMEMRWFRSKFSEAAFSYKNQHENREEQLAQYAGRTSLVEDLLVRGQAALRIHGVRVPDNGQYTCFFRKDSFYEEAGLELKVAGMGSAPQVHITGPEGDGVRVVCMALGWFPEPQVQWRDPRGEKIHEFSEAYTKDSEGLFSVEAALVVRDSAVGSVTCSILNPTLGQEKEMTMVIPEPFFPRVSPWKPAFLVILPLLLLLLLGAACCTWREHSVRMRELREQGTLCQAKEEDRQAKEEALKDTAELQAMLAWRKAQLYADWRKEKFQPWSVTLDPHSAHSSIALSSDKKTLNLKDSSEDVGDTCSILGLQGITSGCCYWEVEVKGGDKSVWAVGVCRSNVNREGWYKETPEKGFWNLGHFESGFCACTSNSTKLSLRENPHKVGVFLDYDHGDVSFYNMTEGSHIFSFTAASFSGTLFPYFMCISGDVSLTLCPLEAEIQKPSVPMNNPFILGETVGPLGEGVPSGSSEVGAHPGLYVPLLSCNSEAMYA
ncbi:PREDICTED: butyrophilin subfamily 1 member A1-like [Condylura cristata]|uniref:butyrophilin subfamily 1 member A1-like n=1 Tax=Condylura cristata TaxID=143302 RepID=UPI000334789C|nr:PREDICTED: butyrophilin subfamily 1 member A1-like [Condylura cristata]